MKNPIKIYLENRDINTLKQKADHLGYNGKGAISRYIEKICRQPIIFVDDNVIELIKNLKLKK